MIEICFSRVITGFFLCHCSPLLPFPLPNPDVVVVEISLGVRDPTPRRENVRVDSRRRRRRASQPPPRVSFFPFFISFFFPSSEPAVPPPGDPPDLPLQIPLPRAVLAVRLGDSARLRPLDEVLPRRVFPRPPSRKRKKNQHGSIRTEEEDDATVFIFVFLFFSLSCGVARRVRDFGMVSK